MQTALSILQAIAQHTEQQERAVYQCPVAPQLEQQLDLSLNQQGQSLESLQDSLQTYLDYNPDVSSSDFYKLLYSGRNEAALLGDWIASLSNANMHTYQMSPVATLMELALIKGLNQLVGFDQGDGVIVSGGSQANIIAMLLARHQTCPHIKTDGIQETLVAFTSDQAHYSLQKAAHVLGIGTKQLIAIESNEQGQIKPEALEQAIQASIQQGHKPFFISLTAGTTVLGAYDDVKACSDIAKKYGLWLHIDGAWGAPVLFSQKHKHLLAHSELADSFTWDAHKLMNVPITAGFILVKQAGLLEQTCSGGGSDYLFHSDENAPYNLGQRSIQCGRRADALKVWLSWQATGTDGFAEKINYLQQLKQSCCELIQQHSRFQLLAPATYLNVLFRYAPEQTLDEQQLRQLTIQISKHMVQQGSAYVDYAQHAGKTALRLILANDQTTPDDLQRLLNDCERVAQEILATH